jgi:hypothetical protein
MFFESFWRGQIRGFRCDNAYQDIKVAQTRVSNLTVVLVEAIEQSAHTIIPELDDTIVKTDHDPGTLRVCKCAYKVRKKTLSVAQILPDGAYVEQERQRGRLTKRKSLHPVGLGFEFCEKCVGLHFDDAVWLVAFTRGAA